MEEFKLFRKIVKWMLAKDGISTNDITQMANLTLQHYRILMETTVKPEHISAALKAKVQDFNKKHFDEYMTDKHLDELVDDPKFVPQESVVTLEVGEEHHRTQIGTSTDNLSDSYLQFDNVEDELKEVPSKDFQKKAEEASAVNELIYSEERNKRRVRERAQEKIFFETLQRLRDVTPEHMSFDIILKHE